ncbi:MAG TPA: Spy/CpxP family protein refolding chaperone [Terriglobales bacterium]|nr:Spy/CpxP family protein refolding chaperone [Terriglobales bacterium]
MSPKKMTLISILILAFLVLSTGLAFSQMTGKEKPSKQGLGLTPEQKEKIRSIVFEGRKEQIRLQSDLKIGRLQLRELMTQDNPDKFKIDKMIDDIGAIRTRMQKARVERMLSMRDILTKEQIQSLKERRMHRVFDRRVIRKRIRMDDRGQGFQRQGMGMGSVPDEAMPEPLDQEEEIELSNVPEEPTTDPEQALIDEELAPLFDEVEPPAPPIEELQSLPDEAPLQEESH